MLHISHIVNVSSSACNGTSELFHIMGSNTVIFAVLRRDLCHPYTVL